MNPNAPPPGYPGAPPAQIKRPAGPPVDLTNPPTSAAPMGMSPQQIAYQNALNARRAAAPVAGGPPPTMPRLDQPHIPGMTIADQGEALRRQALSAQEALRQQGSSILQPGNAQAAAPVAFQLLPGDTLPDEAMKDPECMHGAGERFATNQPHLAGKYGVIRQKRHITPDQMARGDDGTRGLKDGKLRPETVNDLNKLSEVMRNQADGKEEEKVETKPEKKTDQVDEKARISSAISTMDDFDIARLLESVREDALNNPEQRKIVEERIKERKLEMNIDDLIVEGYAEQRVPIIPGKFEPIFRSLSGTTDLALKRMLFEEMGTLRVAEDYFRDKFALMTCVAGTVSIVANNPLPSFTDDEGVLVPEKFWAKFKLLARQPFWMLASLSVHHGWFEHRVRSMFRAENIKNG